jgi:hypothetical protein
MSCTISGFTSICTIILFRPLAGAKSTGVLGKHKRSTKSIKTMATEAKDIVKSVRSLIDTQRKFLKFFLNKNVY